MCSSVLGWSCVHLITWDIWLELLACLISLNLFRSTWGRLLLRSIFRTCWVWSGSYLGTVMKMIGLGKGSTSFSCSWPNLNFFKSLPCSALPTLFTICSPLPTLLSSPLPTLSLPTTITCTSCLSTISLITVTLTTNITFSSLCDHQMVVDIYQVTSFFSFSWGFHSFHRLIVSSAFAVSDALAL